MKIKRLSINVLLLLGSVVAALLLAEVALRVVRPSALLDNDTTLLTEYDSLLGWRKIPNASAMMVSSEYEIEETINSRGLRGPERTYEKPDGVKRILLLGDSFLEGYTVDIDGLVSTVLESRLNQNDSTRYEVINGGTAGYSTDQQVLFFESEGVKYQPDLTVLLFYVNDVWYNLQTRYWRGFKPVFVVDDTSLVLTNVPVPPPDRENFAFEVSGGTGIVRLIRRADAWFAIHSRLYGVARLGMTNSAFINRMAIKTGASAIPAEFRAWYVRPDDELDSAWRTTETLLRRLKGAAATAGGEFMVFYVPSRPSIYPDDWKRTKYKYAMEDDEWNSEQDATVLRPICHALELSCLFPSARFRQEADQLGGEGKALYFARDAHWTPEGHALAAGLLADAILARAESSF